jgi:hypothetical protein
MVADRFSGFGGTDSESLDGGAYGRRALVGGIDGAVFIYLSTSSRGNPRSGLPDRRWWIYSVMFPLGGFTFEVELAEETCGLWRSAVLGSSWSTLHMQGATDEPLRSFSCAWGGTCPPLLGMAFLLGVVEVSEEAHGRSGQCDDFR